MTVNNGTGKLVVKQLQGEIKKLFADSIDLTDLEGTRIDKEVAFLSRGLAAYTLYSLAGISADEAGESVVDGSGDNALDAIFWHKNNNTLWLIQSKWIKKGTGQPKADDINSFATGVRNLIEDNLDRPNLRLIQQKEEADKALATMGVKVNIVITHTGQNISKASRKHLDNLIKDLNLNEIEDIFTYQVFDRDRAYKIAIENAERLNIETELRLLNWGKIDAPYSAFYGSVSALELAELWQENGNNLFSQNLRDFIGRTKANDEIYQTLKEDPDSFWYFNNGITALCREIRRRTKGVKRLSDDFLCKGITIINGAQTIGSIGRFYQDNSDTAVENLEQVEVLIKLISLEGCPDDFGMKVTRATNTQNHVENRDFLALDPIQRKIARELKAWDKSKTYFYKRSDEIVSTENACTLAEVTKALACSNNDIRLTSTTKKDITEIWSDTSSSLYKRVFNPSISPVKLWRSVEIYRLVRRILESKSKDSRLMSKIVKYADLFIFHVVFQDIERDSINIFQDDFSFEDYDLFLPKIERVIENVHDELSKLPSSTRFGAFFKNHKKCNELKQKILVEL